MKINIQPIDYVDPMIGAITTSHDTACGKTFPGAATPFGMVQLSPDTVSGGDNTSGYSSEMTTIEGFSFTHMSGAGWYGELGNLQVVPQTGPLVIDREAANSEYDKNSEHAQAGYYGVTLKRYGVQVELTAAPHAGILQFKFPTSPTSRIKVDLTRRIGGDGAKSSIQFVRQVDAQTYEGWMKCDPSGKGWGQGAGGVKYTLYFSLQLSVPAARFGVWDDGKFDFDAKECTGTSAGFVLEFGTTEDTPMLLKAGLSFASIDGARANLAHDIPGWDFNAICEETRSRWSDALGAVSVTGGSEAQRTIFHTSLYHALIDPRSVTDVDGSYSAPDGPIRQADGWTNRTCFSGWDVFRAEFPLLNLIAPDVVKDTINTLMEIHKRGDQKGLARWEFMGRDTPIMIGDPALSVIADAYLKGIRGFDIEDAYRACLGVAQGPLDQSNRNGMEDWLKRGYVSGHLSISETLENAYADFALSRFAHALGRDGDAAALVKTSRNYRNVFDETIGWFRARNADGSWQRWEGRIKSGGCVESNPGQQGWFVPQDVDALIGLVGGRAAFIKQLDEFFSRTTPGQIKVWNDWYNHSNEPVHNCAFLFTYAGAPWLTQKWSRFICDHAYGLGASGLCGNDDLGQMSAWYVFSAAGLYPACPASNVYILGSPMFDTATFQLPLTGKSFTIAAHGANPANIYVQRAELNGAPLMRAWLSYDEIAAGGQLAVWMGPEPNLQWGSAAEFAPPSAV